MRRGAPYGIVFSCVPYTELCVYRYKNSANVSNKKTATCVTVFKVFRSAEAVGSVVAITVNRSC